MSERYRRGGFDREERFEPEMAQKKRPKRRKKKNKGQRRKRVLWEDKRKARKSYLELKEQVHEQLNLPFELEKEFEVDEFSDTSSEIPNLRIPGDGTKDRRKWRKTQRIRV
jgi:hypothetical protein